MAESFTYFDDVVEYVEHAINSDGEHFSWDDCKNIAEHVSEWDEDLQKFVPTKDGDDFWAAVSAYALA